MIKYFEDLKVNKKNIKGIYILFWFRLANASYRLTKKSKLFLIFIFPIFILYKILIEWMLSVEISFKTQIGKGLKFDHCIGTIVNGNVSIGDYCLLRHCTTIGIRKGSIVPDVPTIGNHVSIGSNCVLIGKITIGDNSIIGAGSVVLNDVPPRTIAAGNPAKIIRVLD